jgi:prevent-host-death family protein
MTDIDHDVIMTEVLNVADAKRRFSELIDRVGRGEQFIVARRGTPVLALVAPDRVDESVDVRPGGILSLVGLFSDWPEMEDDLRAVVASRHLARDRDGPDLG